jgi:uncharacterized protein YggT (Ycf19 family)
MQGIYTYIPETNNVPKQHNVTAILSLLFMVPISLAAALALMYFYISTFRSIIIIIIIIASLPSHSSSKPTASTILYLIQPSYRCLTLCRLMSYIYICRTAPLTSRCCVLNIYSTNMRTKYFKHAA